MAPNLQVAPILQVRQFLRRIVGKKQKIKIKFHVQSKENRTKSK